MITTAEGVLLSHEEYSELKKLEADNLYLKNELAQLKRMIFGQKSERFVPVDGQLSLNFDTEAIALPTAGTEEISYTRKKNKPLQASQPIRQPLPAHLPRVEIQLEPEQDVQNAKRIGEVVTEILEYNPGKLFVKKYIRPKYALPKEEGIVIAPMPMLPIEKGNAGPGLLAHILISKFVDHLPFYRQAQIFKRQDVELAESTLNGWFSASCKLLEPLFHKLREEVLRNTYLMVDETPIPVLTKDKPGATHKGYYWSYYSPHQRLVFFDYQKGRGRDGPETFLKTYQGALQTDGYSAYDIYETRPGITLLACMAHARRKFEHAKDNDLKRSALALHLFQQLYEVERTARELKYTYDERRQTRIEKSLPIIREMESWLKDESKNVMPRSAIGAAISYTLNLWPRLKRYLGNGMYEIDNNLIENSIRPIALGRKNYLFAGSHEAAEKAAMIYSFLGTCKQNQVEPFAWLSDVLDKIPEHKANRLAQLLPHNWMQNPK